MTQSISVDERIARLSYGVRHVLKRSGAAVQVSGGIDSAVTLQLAARALGPDHVLPLFLPDRASASISAELAALAAEGAGCSLCTVPITELVLATTPPAEAAVIICRYVPSYDVEHDGYAINIDAEASLRLATPVFRLHVGPVQGQATTSVMLRPTDLRALMAIQNVKQRLRMIVAYRHAEAHGYAVIGASNADELDLGFTVKFGDDAADLYAIADLNKDDVRALAISLDIPKRIRDRPPTTDTFTLQQSQADYYYLGDPSALRSVDTHDPSDDHDSALSQIVSVYRQTAHYNSQRLRLDELDVD